MFSQLAQDPVLFDALSHEFQRQQNTLELIASENIVSEAVLAANGSVFTNKYSEGYPGKRYYAGNEFVDVVETLAIDRAKQLFGAEYVNVQPLSGSPVNIAVYLTFLQPKDTILALKLDHGGHLSHGHPLNASGQLYTIVDYGVDPQTHQINMAEVRRLAIEHRPKMIVAGFSAYSRSLDWKAFRSIADEVGAILFADIAHIAGLIAGKQLENPLPYCDVVTTTTHKTLRGPRGALLMAKEKYAKDLNRAIFPGIQGGPHVHSILAKAIAFGEALKPEFEIYARQVIKNAQCLSDELIKKGCTILTGGTDNHLFLLDVAQSWGIGGKDAEHILESIGLSVNKNLLPFDTRKPLDPSGIRIGTPSITTRGMKEDTMCILATCIDNALSKRESIESLRETVAQIAQTYPAYPGIQI